MPARISTTHFAGLKFVHDLGPNGLTAAVRGLSQNISRIAATSVAALTDNSGGATADGTIGAIGLVTPAVVGTNDATQKAEVEASFGNVVDALKELAAKHNAIAAKVPVPTVTDSLTGTAADGTIGAIDATMTGVGSSMALASDVNTVIAALRNRVATCAVAINKLCDATGITPVVDSSGGTPDYSLTLAAVTTTVATGDGSSASDATKAIAKATATSTQLAALAAAVKELATKLNAVRDDSAGYLVARTVAS